MLLNILVLLKTILYVNITEIKFNKILVFLMTALISIVILEFINRMETRHKKKIRLIFYSILSIVMFVDVVYYIQFSTLPSIALLGQVSQLSAVGDSVKYLLDFKNILLILDLPILIVFYIINRERIDSEGLNIEAIKFQADIDRYRLRQKVKDMTLKVSVSLLALSMVGVAALDKYDSVKSQELYTYHLTDIIDSLLKRGEVEVLSKSDISELEKRTDLKDGKHTGIARDKNLIVVQVEALQNFVIGLEYEGQEVTPELNKLIKDKSTIYYDNYYQLVGRGNTSDAEFVSHNSLHPSMEEPSYTRFENNDFYGLPKLLKEKGYKTIAMHGHDGEYWNRRKAYKKQGFDEFLDDKFYKVDELIGLGVRDEDFFRQNVQYLKDYKSKNKQPFYSFMVTLTSHTPYNMPEKYRSMKISKEHEGTILGNYLQAINYTDKQIGLLIDELKAAGLYEDTAIALYGDHYGISSAHEDDQKLMSDFLGYNYDYDEMMNIPLIVHVPASEINERVSKVGSQLDFYPTILNIMGQKNEKGLMFGRDLNNFEGYNFVAPQTYMRKGSFIDDTTTFVISRDGIFDHSRAYEKEGKKEIEDIEDLRPTHERAIKEINRSDYILNHNLLKEYIASGGKIDLKNFKGETELDVMEIYELERNSMEEIEKAYEAGERLVSIDLELTSDDGVVLLKDWGKTFKENFESDKSKLSLEEFKALRMKNGERPISLEDLTKWLTTHMDMKVVLRAARDESEILIRAYQEAELDEAVVQIGDFESYLDVTNNRYREVILDPSIKEYNSKQVMDFISRYPSISILVDRDVEDSKLKELSGKGIDIYRYR